MTITAVYVPVLFNVYFMDGWSEEVVSEQQVPYLCAAEAPADPVREGYIFAGWDTDFSCIEHDLVVTALWERQYFTVIFTGTYTGSETVEYGADCPLPVYNSASLCYTFTVDGEEWCPENITSDMTVTVGVALIKNTYYTVTFIGMNGEIISQQSVKHGEAAVIPEAPAVPGYRFVGWDRDVEMLSYVTYSVTRYAVYEQIDEPGMLLGDVDGDGIVTMSDVTLLSMYLNGENPQITEPGMANADANEDGTIDIRDITAIYTIIANS
ncbi:MAG: InlB B-repeat-containing protein [Oscillospiraceae bacterium]|nr:InlB B-repeat-containing protein [Oscillospiraceae bacterium]